MRLSSIVGFTLATPLLFAGCARQMAMTEIQPTPTPFAVRFLTPTPSERFAQMGGQPESRLVADESFDGVDDGGFTDQQFGGADNTRHVALWGGRFQGDNVTFSATPLAPGSYMFAFFSPNEDRVIQGWVEVNFTNNDIIDVLMKWKADIPQRKNRLAYEFDLNGQTKADESSSFEAFANQLSAIDRLESQIAQAISKEINARNTQLQSSMDFLSSAQLLLLPGANEMLQPTTQSAFTEAELASVRNGEPLTKLLLVADYTNAQWKLNQINNLYGELGRYETVLHETIGRLERRKGKFLLTDHLHNHDEAFIRNERQIQFLHGEMEAIHEHMMNLRERRMALAFVTELVAPDGTFKALEQERGDLLRERTVLQSEKQRIDMLCDETDTNNVRRVTFERDRQRTLKAIESIDQQLVDLRDARKALVQMTEASNTIHRQGDKRLLTATLVTQNMPIRVREAIEQEAIMTIRIEATDSAFVPATRVTTTSYQPAHTGYTSQPRVMHFNANTANATSATSRRSNAVFAERAGSSITQSVGPKRPATSNRGMAMTYDTSYMTSTSTYTDPWQQEVNEEVEDNGDPCNLPFFVKLFIPPCWFSGNTNAVDTYDPGNESVTLANMTESSDSASVDNSKCDLPLLIKLLVPPCWFDND